MLACYETNATVRAIPDIVLCVLQIGQVLASHTQDKWCKTDALCVFLVAKKIT
jgi:hypothetical protein